MATYKWDGNVLGSILGSPRQFGTGKTIILDLYEENLVAIQQLRMVAKFLIVLDEKNIFSRDASQLFLKDDFSVERFYEEYSTSLPKEGFREYIAETQQHIRREGAGCGITAFRFNEDLAETDDDRLLIQISLGHILPSMSADMDRC